MTTNKYVLSGACAGADTYITDLASEYGVTPVHFSFKGHERISSFNPNYKGKRILLTQEEINSYSDFYERLCPRIKRGITKKPLVRNLLIRDFFQVLGRKEAKSELVITVDTLENNLPKGGSLYAVAMAMKHRIPVILIDKENGYKCLFYDYESRRWRHLRKSDLHKINTAFTGIGSRYCDQEAVRKTIKEIFKYIL